MLTLTPFWLIRLCHTMKRLSNWIDTRFFPVPATKQDIKNRDQQTTEDCGIYLQRRIRGCKTLKECYACWDGIEDLKLYCGDTAQVKGWRDSLWMQLKSKIQEITNSH